MLTYLLRRHVVVVVLAPLLLFSIVVYGPGGVVDYPPALDPSTHPVFSMRWPYTHEQFDNTLRTTFHLNKQWPWNYAHWIFDPSDPYRWDSQTDNLFPAGLSFFGLTVLGSGALTGDFGPSTSVARAVDVDELFGPGLSQLILVPLTLILALSLLVTGQRWKRGYYARAVLPDRPIDLTSRYQCLR